MIKLASGCIDCGYAAHSAALQFDHIDNNKKANVSDLIRSDYGWKTIKEEINKCVVRCANCHAVITASRRAMAPCPNDTELVDPYLLHVRMTPIDLVLPSIQIPGDEGEHFPESMSHSESSVRQ